MTSIEIAIAKHEQQLGHLESRLEQVEGQALTVARQGETLEHIRQAVASIKDKQDKMYLWLIGLLGGVIASLVILVLRGVGTGA